MCRAAGRVGDELVVEDRSARSASAHGAQRDHDEPFRPYPCIPLDVDTSARPLTSRLTELNVKRDPPPEDLCRTPEARRRDVARRALYLALPVPYLINTIRLISSSWRRTRGHCHRGRAGTSASLVADRVRITARGRRNNGSQYFVTH